MTELNELIGITYMASRTEQELDAWHERCVRANTDPVYREQVINLVQSADPNASREKANEYINLSTELVEAEYRRRNLPLPKIEEAPIDESKLNEEILPDDYPIHAGYCYICDGKVIASNYETNVIGLKAKMSVREVRKCDLAGRGLL